MRKVYQVNSDIKKLDYSREVSLSESVDEETGQEFETEKIDYNKDKLKRLELEEDEDEPGHIKLIWFLSFVLLITADVLEFIFSIIGLASAGLLSVLSFIPLIFEIPGALCFLYLINFYIKNGHIPITSGIFYLFLVFIEFFGFIPLLGSLAEIAPLKTIAMLISRTKTISMVSKRKLLWRTRRLREFKKEIK